MKRGFYSTVGISFHRSSEDFTSVFLSKNETFRFYSERYREDLHTLSQILRGQIQPVSFMFRLGFAIFSSVMSLFSTMNRNIVVHWQEEGVLSFPRPFRERNRSLKDHRWQLCSALNNPHEKKKSCSLPQGILLFFELNHLCSHQDQIDNNNI